MMESRTMHDLQARRCDAAAALLRLLSQEELRALAVQLSVETATVECLAPRLSDLPRFQVVAIALTIAESTLQMLRDILSYLEHHGIAARTTGCALLLADPVQGDKHRIDLSPQEASAIASWTPKSKRNLRDSSFRDALADWRSIEPTWRQLLEKARPRIKRGQMDVVGTYINRQAGSSDIEYGPDRDLTDASAQGVLRALLDRVVRLADLLGQLPSTERPPSCDTLLQEMRELLATAQRRVFAEQRRHGAHSSSPRSSPDERSRRTLLQHVNQRFLDTFDRLAEDLYLLADLVEADRILDIISTSIWASRPQLYEVWFLVSILRWFEACGYRVDLLKVGRREVGCPEWRLAHANDSVPCARIRGGTVRDAGVYYQLYRESGNMPDLCLIPGQTSAATAWWAIDAKHSEAGAYTLGTYRATAERYRKSFGANLSLVVEYFPRTDLVSPGQNPLHFGPGTVLVTDAAPGQAGLTIALNLLQAIHPPAAAAVFCIDMSQSFRSRVDAAFAEALVQLRNEGAFVSDSFICFADTATTEVGMRALFDSDTSNVPHVMSNSRLGTGTQLDSLLRELRSVAKTSAISEILLVSDASFPDSTAPLDNLSVELGVPVRLYL